MGHHGSEEMSSEMQQKLEDALKRDKEDGVLRKQLAAESPQFGASGKYPMGKLDKSDEGEITFGIASHRGKVIVNFGKPVAWLGMDAAQAVALAASLLEHAHRCRDIGREHKTESKATGGITEPVS